MPRVAASNGVRPEIRALAVFKIGVPVTPAEINTHVGTGDYAAKYVSFLNTRYGFTITTQKDGRRVVSYTMVAEPANAADLRSMTPKVPKTKAPKVAKAKTVTVIVPSNLDTAVTGAKVQVVPKVKAPKKVAAKKSVAAIKAANLAKLKAVGQRFKAEQVQVLTEAPASTSFSIDNDWDSVEGLDLAKLVG
jgi:hypothetical protein